MSADCCGHNATFDGLSADYKRRLWLVVAINAVMFVVEMAAGALVRLAGTAGRRARFLRRHRHLWHEPRRDRRVAEIACDHRAPQGHQPAADGAVGDGLDAVACVRRRRTARRNHGRRRLHGARRQCRQRAHSRALQGRRRQCALGLAVLAQRRHRQHHRHGGGDWRVGHGDQMARPHRRGDHGRSVPVVVMADRAPVARRTAHRRVGAA